MSINDKGEFIRSNSGASSSATATDARSPLWSLENICLLAMVIGAAVLLAGMIWLVVHYWEPIACVCLVLIALKMRRRS